MSVLACDRRGCESIMCDRVSNTHGYICDECFDELSRVWPVTSIDQFMDSAKREAEIDHDEAVEILSKKFPSRWEE